MVVKSRYTRQLKFITSHLPNWIQPLHEFVATFIAVKLGFGWVWLSCRSLICGNIGVFQDVRHHLFVDGLPHRSWPIDQLYLACLGGIHCL